jgi:hypothetical protein
MMFMYKVTQAMELQSVFLEKLRQFLPNVLE